MVISGALRVCYLLSFLVSCFRGTEAVDVDQNALDRIIRDFHNRYRLNGTLQHALAINVPAHYCEADSSLDANYLRNDDPDKVIEALNSTDRVYEGTEMIGARPKPATSGGGDYHSEYLLLNPPSPYRSRMRRLLVRNRNGCVVFYTYNSPCVNTCLNPYRERNIINALRMFWYHKGPKAFVFRNVWWRDADLPLNRWISDMMEVDVRVPLYRCDSTGCKRCVNNGVFNKICELV